MIQVVSLDTTPFRDAPASRARLCVSLRALHQDVTCLGIGGDSCGTMRVVLGLTPIDRGVMRFTREPYGAREH